MSTHAEYKSLLNHQPRETAFRDDSRLPGENPPQPPGSHQQENGGKPGQHAELRNDVDERAVSPDQFGESIDGPGVGGELRHRLDAVREDLDRDHGSTERGQPKRSEHTEAPAC